MSISLQHVEEWKYYELTNLKSKRHQVHEQLHRVHGHEHHETGRNNEDKRTEDCTQLSGCRGAGRYLLSIDFLTNFFSNKSSLSFFFFSKTKTLIQEIPKRVKPDKLSIVRPIYAKQRKGDSHAHGAQFWYSK